MPSYQVEDVAELYRNMRDRDAKALEQAVTEGKCFKYSHRIWFGFNKFLGLEKVFADPRAKFGATTEQLSHFKSDMVQAQSESAIGACLRDFIRLYRWIVAALSAAKSEKQGHSHLTNQHTLCSVP